MVAAWGIGGEVGKQTLLTFLPVFIDVITIIITIIMMSAYYFGWGKV